MEPKGGNVSAQSSREREGFSPPARDGALASRRTYVLEAPSGPSEESSWSLSPQEPFSLSQGKRVGVHSLGQRVNIWLMKKRRDHAGMVGRGFWVKGQGVRGRSKPVWRIGSYKRRCAEEGGLSQPRRCSGARAHTQYTHGPGCTAVKPAPSTGCLSPSAHICRHLYKCTGDTKSTAIVSDVETVGALAPWVTQS